MSRYSSDSDSSSYHRRNRHKRRSSSTSSSDSSRHRKSKSSTSRRSSRYHKSSKSYSSRSYKRSRSKSKTSSRHSRSSSKDRRRRRSYSREKYRHKNHYKSRSHSKGRNPKYHSRSSSSSDSKNSSSSSTSKSSSNNSNKKTQAPTSNSSVNPEEQLREKLLKAIKAAESADHLLKEQGVLPKGVKSRNDISSLTNTKPQSDVIRDINADEFVQKSFTSSKTKKEGNFDELNITNEVEEVDSLNVDENSIFPASFFMDPKAKMDKWVKKLFMIRQRAISGEPFT